jgi:hypothetical protein
MTSVASLNIVSAPSDGPHRTKPVHVPIICSPEWIMRECIPLMKWVIDAANQCENDAARDPLVIAAEGSLPKDINDDSLVQYVTELCMFEVLSDELSVLKDSCRKHISSTQETCVQHYQLSVAILFSEVLVSSTNVENLGESSIDLFEYCMRKVRNTCILETSGAGV